jgi:hypothetical protein
MEEEYLDKVNYLTMSPEQIATELFSKDPDDECSKQIFGENKDNNNASYIFEIAATIFMEGVGIVLGGLNNLDINLLTPEYLLALNPWFHSIGFKIHIDVVNKNNKTSYEDYYCKIIIKNHEYGPFFDIKKILKDYHFLCNQKYKDGCFIKHFKNIYAIFVKYDQVYKISFNLIV